jgi:hypothetical protein
MFHSFLLTPASIAEAHTLKAEEAGTVSQPLRLYIALYNPHAGVRI